MEWSIQQSAFFADVTAGRGNTVLLARAGTGKTTTIIEASGRLSDQMSILLVAFNKRIAQELQSRAPAHVVVKTLHSVGFSMLTRAHRGIRVDNDKTRELAALTLIQMGQHTRGPDGRPRAIEPHRVAKLAGLAKNTLCDPQGNALIDLAEDFDLCRFDDKLRPDVLADATSRTLAACRADLTRCDFDDMLWLPVVLDLSGFRNDVVFVDEAQDINGVQLAILRKIVKTNGRLFAVGDDAQAIYQFRGADHNAIGRIEREFNCKELPLSITYRCPRSVVAIARQRVPEYEAGPGAPEGIVRSVLAAQFRAQPGDFVLSRSNAPLVQACLEHIAAGIPSMVVGRDIGMSLGTLVEKSKQTAIPEMLVWIRDYTSRECERLEAAGKDPGRVLDIEATILALSTGCADVSALMVRIETMFADEDSTKRVAFSTVHKAKGLERDRVWILSKTFERRDSASLPERNIYYVAVTRAKRELIFVRSDSEGL